MKKLLIYAYDFQPYVKVGGLRPYNWCRYLKEFGVEPIVVTRQWENTDSNHLDYIASSASTEVMKEHTGFGIILNSNSPNELAKSIYNVLIHINDLNLAAMSLNLKTKFGEEHIYNLLKEKYYSHQILYKK